MKKLRTVNVDYLQNRHAQDIIHEMISEGWGIDAMVEDSRRNTWITFYKYEEGNTKAPTPPRQSEPLE